MKSSPHDTRSSLERRRNGKESKFSVTHAKVAEAIRKYEKRGGLIQKLPPHPDRRGRRVQTGSWAMSAYEEITFEEFLP